MWCDAQLPGVTARGCNSPPSGRGPEPGVCAQVFALCTGMVAWAPGFAAAGILALLSPLFVPFLPVFAPVRSDLLKHRHAHSAC